MSVNGPQSHRPRVAVVGSGVAGIVAAYILDRAYAVTIFEKGDYLGGHTNTVVIQEGEDAGTPIDTGFIVLNDKTYPTVQRFLKELEVPVRWADMSFGYFNEGTNLQYAGMKLSGLFAQPVNLVRPRFLRMLWEIRRFAYAGEKFLRDPRLNLTLRAFLENRKFSKEVIHEYIVPIGASIWSVPDADMLEFPAQSFLRFFANHGLLTLYDRPRWQTIVGGSQTYVRKFRERFGGQVVLNNAVEQVWRREHDVVVRCKDGNQQLFDHVVFACHADQALRCLADPNIDERAFLGAWKYQDNHTILHTDTSFLPPSRRAWASWNYRREAGRSAEHPVSVTYDMNRLQGLRTKHQYCVTLNATRAVPPEKVIREFVYSHPVYSAEAVNSQATLSRLHAERRTWYCGSYCGYGFHEDAALSAVNVAKALKVEW